MKITCWGARGSIPVSGKEYQRYGGDTTCLEIRSRDNDIIIVDAGTGIRKLGNKLLASGESALNILFTHAHWDHLMGFPFFKPIYSKKTAIKLYGCAYTQQSIEKVLSKSMIAPYFPVDFTQLQAAIIPRTVCEEPFAIGPVLVTPIQLSHPNRGIGYKFTEDNKSFVFLTDNELTLRHSGGCDYEEYLRFARDADILVHDAEYTQEQYKITKGWGHSVYTDALRLAMEAGVKEFGLFHHNQDRSDDELDRIVEDCRRIAGRENSRVRCYGMEAGMELTL
ncbi:MAG: metal-dependent hydrolase [Nitrospirae bacterium GWC2_57_9]|nr:MAG: metal-dependent hydrolase [Nitrospirae bacterium GWC2_57_9]